jgi:hypothetical protein
MTDLPSIALSVRQPWAWAIVAGHKPVENRTAAAIRMGCMTTGPIAIHAAKGMTRAEYDDAAEFMAMEGIACPRPDELIRGAIIGTAIVVGFVSDYPSPWFFGPRALALSDARTIISPIPAAGQLGYFTWQAGGALAEPLQWMRSWPGKAQRATKPEATLFDKGESP